MKSDLMAIIAKYILGALIVLGFFSLLGILMYMTIPEGNSDLLYLAVGALIGSFTTVVGYFYGSSQGSKDKDRLLNSGTGAK